MARLEHGGECPDEVRDVIACETGKSIGRHCRSESGCDVEYKTYDFCRGTCALGAIAGGRAGASQSDCYWAFDDCYGHSFKTTCYTGGEDSACVCFADDELLDTCFMGYGLAAFEGCETLSIFTTCCRDLYEESLFP